MTEDRTPEELIAEAREKYEHCMKQFEHFKSRAMECASYAAAAKAHEARTSYSSEGLLALHLATQYRSDAQGAMGFIKRTEERQAKQGYAVITSGAI